MFCPSCGLESQTAGTYCRRCGATQPDPAAAGAIAVRQMTRMQKIRKMKTLGVASGAFSLVAAAILIWTIFQPDVMYRPILTIAAICSLLIAISQAINFFLGREIFEPPSSRAQTPLLTKEGWLSEAKTGWFSPPGLAPQDTTDLSVPSVTEGTTRTLQPVERQRVE